MPNQTVVWGALELTVGVRSEDNLGHCALYLYNWH